MKKLFYLLLCVFLASCGQQKESSNQSPMKEINDDRKGSSSQLDSGSIIINPSSIEEIKQAYAAATDKLQRNLLDSASFKYNCNNERSGTITYFSEKAKLVMIRHIYNEYDHHSANDQYFVSDNGLYFAYLNTVLWSFESGRAAEGATKDDVTEQRLYILKEKPVQCLEKKYTILSHSSDNPKPETIQSKQVDCKPVRPLLNQFDKLVAFKEDSDRECFEK